MGQSPKKYSYRIIVKGILDQRWQDWFDFITLEVLKEEHTIIHCNQIDQAALNGLLNALGNRNINIISLHRLSNTELLP